MAYLLQLRVESNEIDSLLETLRDSGCDLLQLNFVLCGREDLLHHVFLDRLESLRHGGSFLRLTVELAVEVLIVNT